MNRLANVLVLDQNRHRAESIQQRLERGGYHASLVDDLPSARTAALTEHPDLIIIGDVNHACGLSEAASLKAEPSLSDIPVLALAEQITPALAEQAYQSGMDDLLAAGCEDTELYARLRPLVRLATMHGELRQRAAIARTLGIQARHRVDGATSRPSVLIIGDEASAAQAILANDADLTLCQNFYEAEELLCNRNYDAAVICFAGEGDGALGFCTQVRNNPRLFNLPMVLVAGMGTDRAEAYRRGASRVILRPLEPDILRTAVLTLVRRQQLRWSIRSALNDSLQVASQDPLTGAYNRAFMQSHLDARISLALEQNRHLAVIFFSAPNIDGVRKQFGDDAALHLTQQVGQWITGLLRAEDLTATYKTNEFCVILPDTPLHEAEVVMHRIAGVLAYTDFAVRDVYQPVKVWVQVGCTDVREHDTLDSLLSRARANLD